MLGSKLPLHLPEGFVESNQNDRTTDREKNAIFVKTTEQPSV